MLEKNVKKRARPSKYNQPQSWLDKNDYTSQGVYIANINTKILHQTDCRHIKNILTENQLLTDNTQALYRPCSHCTPDKNHYQTLLQLSNLQKHAITCTDPTILKLFEAGCTTHGTHNGTIKMYPDNNYGTKIQGKPGKWHIYHHCHTCNKHTPLHIAQTHHKTEQLNIKKKIAIW